jgi:hypothetical protein
MSDSRFSDETLMAFADGEADPDTARAIDRAIRSDRELAARAEMFRRTSILAKQAFKADLELPVPDRLRASVRGAIERATQGSDPPQREQTGTHGGLPPDRLPRSLFFTWWSNRPMYALAASLAALGIGVLGFFAGSLSDGGHGAYTMQGVTVTRGPAEQAAFLDALSYLPSGQRRELIGGDVEILASVRDRAASLCREFRISRRDERTFGVACRSGGQWEVTAAATTHSAVDGYAPASSPSWLDSYLADIEAGPPLAPEEELAALAAEQEKE